MNKKCNEYEYYSVQKMTSYLSNYILDIDWLVCEHFLAPSQGYKHKMRYTDGIHNTKIRPALKHSTLPTGVYVYSILGFLESAKSAN